MNWIGLKAELVGLIGLDRDALHVYAAVAFQLVVAGVTRRSLASFAPWLAVAGVELVNESADYFLEVWPDRALQQAGGLHDLVNTMLMPTVLLIASRYAPHVLTEKEPSA